MIQQPNKMYFQDGLLGEFGAPVGGPTIPPTVMEPYPGFFENMRMETGAVLPMDEYNMALGARDAGIPMPYGMAMENIRNKQLLKPYIDERAEYDFMRQQTPDLSPRGVNTVQGGRGGPSDPSAYMPPQDLKQEPGAVIGDDELDASGGMSGSQKSVLMQALSMFGGGGQEQDMFANAPGIVRGRPMQQMNFGPSYSQGYTGGLLG